jgi:hypothetical protein
VTSPRVFLSKSSRADFSLIEFTIPEIQPQKNNFAKKAQTLAMYHGAFLKKRRITMAQLLMIAVLLAQLLTPTTHKSGGTRPADGNPMCPAKGCTT